MKTVDILIKGAQGAGKTKLNRRLQEFLATQKDLRIVNVSCDDPTQPEAIRIIWQDEMQGGQNA